MATPTQLKAAQAKLEEATKARDAFKASCDKVQAAFEKKLAKFAAAVAAAQVKADKYAE